MGPFIQRKIRSSNIGRVFRTLASSSCAFRTFSWSTDILCCSALLCFSSRCCWRWCINSSFSSRAFWTLKVSVQETTDKTSSVNYRKLRSLRVYNTTVAELLAFICSYKYLLFVQRCMLFCTQRAEPSFVRRPNVWTSKSCSLSSNWFFESEPPFIDKTDGFNWARYTKRTAIRPGFETVSQQHAAHAQQRSYSGHAESFSNTPKSSKRKKG